MNVQATISNAKMITVSPDLGFAMVTMTVEITQMRLIVVQENAMKMNFVVLQVKKILIFCVLLDFKN